MKGTGFNPKFTITNKITSHLTQIERARGFLEAATLSEEWVREMGRSSDLALFVIMADGTHWCWILRSRIKAPALKAIRPQTSIQQRFS